MPTKTPRERFEEALFNKLKEQYACVMSDGVAKNIAKGWVDYIMPIADTLLEEARKEEREKNKNFYNGVTEYIRIHSPSPEEIQNYIDNNLPQSSL